MAILVWTQTGFAMVILSSAIKGVPDELLEAARIDGATEWQVFRKVTIPTIASTIVVVWTTILITTWKVYDIVAVMTGGRDGTSVVAERMVTEFYTFRNEGLGAALAVVLLVVVLPILIINITGSGTGGDLMTAVTEAPRSRRSRPPAGQGPQLVPGFPHAGLCRVGSSR